MHAERVALAITLLSNWTPGANGQPKMTVFYDTKPDERTPWTWLCEQPEFAALGAINELAEPLRWQVIADFFDIPEPAARAAFDGAKWFYREGPHGDDLGFADPSPQDIARRLCAAGRGRQ